MTIIKLVIASLLLGLVSPAWSAPVNVLNSASTTATGSGTTGIPSLSGFNIPAGKNRVLFIWAAFERDHCTASDACTSANTAGTGLGDNWPEPRIGTPPATTTNNQITATVVGSGSSISKKNALTIGGTPSGDLRFQSMSSSPSGSPTGAAFFSASSFHIALFEGEINALLGGSASGNVSINLPDVVAPNNAGDDAILIASVYENVEQTAWGMVRNATGTAQLTTVGPPAFTVGNYAITVSTYDASPGAPAPAQTPDEADDGKLVMALSTSTEGFLTPAGHTLLANVAATNNNGVFDTTSAGGYDINEPNGFSAGMYFRTGGATPGSGYTLTSAAASTTRVYGGFTQSYLLESDNADTSDAPASYGTPTHTISGIRLGATVDADAAVLANATATGDDTSSTDDEDGVTMPASLTAGLAATVPVSIQSASGLLNVWFDWNKDGDFLDSGEQVVNEQAVATGTTNLNITVPATASGGTTFARFRVCSTTAQCNTPTSVASTGEVEDHAATIIAPMDYSDAPATYGTPSHNIVSGIRLGATAPDNEAAAQPGTGANLDDTTGTDDEDGIALPSLTQGQTATITATVAGAGGYLQGWIDFNGDGDFADSGEQVATNIQDNAGSDTNATAGTITFSVNVPAGATTNQTYARFRWSTTQGLGTTAAANDGEVEDYAITIAAPVIVNCPTEAAGSGSGYATSGTGLYKNDIFWLDWSCGAVTQFNPGDTINKSWTLGNGLQINAQINTITAAIAPYNTGNWGGDTLDDLYSGVNPIGLTNVTDSQDPTYTVSFSASLNGVSIPADIVTAEAEDSGHVNESATWITDGSAWQPIEAFGALSAQFTNAGKTLFMNNDPDAGGGTLLAFSRDVSNIAVDMKAGGKEALAFGVFSSFDYGDIKAGYPASQGHYMRKLASGGSTPAALTSVSSLTLATLTNSTTFYLGATQPDAETADQNSVNADADGTDEDGVVIPALTQGQTATITATVAGAGGYLQGWIDWNGDGDFADAGEQVTTSLQDNATGDTNAAAGIIAFNVNVPASTTTAQTYARFRWSSTSGLNSTSAATDGEVEDYALTILAKGSISGTVFRDDDQSNLQNGAEPGIGLITVSLYRDNGTPTDVTDDTLVTTVETAANGTYTFPNLDPGTYRVNVDTTDSDLPVGALIGTSHPRTGVTVTAGNTTTVDFGFDIFTCTPGGGGATDAAISPYISKEVSGTGVASRNEADTLDDAWRSAAGLPTSGKMVPWLGTTARSLAAAEPALFSTYGVAVDVTRVNIQPASPCLGSAHTSGASLSTASNMQDVSPRPASLYNASTQPAFWTDSGGDNQTPNAVRFTFATPVKSFGAWFGDLETRTDGYARPAWLRLLDSSGNRIGGDIPVTPTDLHNGTTTTAVNQNLCGSTSPGTDTACGNQSSRWVGFVDSAASARIKHVVVIVGDDDFGDDAGTEQLSFIGMDIVQEDFGDASASYGEASHWLALTPKVYLGTTIPDKENQSQNTANGGADGTGDNTAGTNDEDGIANFPVLANGAQDYSLNVTVNNSSGSTARLVGWIDLNRNGVFDTSEAATASVATGASNKTVALTWNSLPADTTPGNSYLRLRLTTDSSIATGTASTSLPTGTAQDGEVEDYAITIGDSGFTLSGKVYHDTNVNGSNDAAEKGIKNVTIALLDTTANSCRSTKTGADGSYHFNNVQPAAVGNYVLYEAAGEDHQLPTACPPVVNDPNGYVSTSPNTLTVTLTNADVTDQDFGDAKLPSFTLEHSQVILPYTTVAYPHVFQAATDGSVSFSLAETAKPTGLEWGVSFLLDNNCDAQLDGGDTAITGIINVTAGDKLCLLAKVIAPANTASGASHTLDITSSFVFGDGSSGLAAVEHTRSDITKTSSGTSSEPVGGEGKLSLQKSVWNTTRNIDGSVALPGETLRYTIAYENIGNGELNELVVNDTVPAFTSLGGAGQGCGTTPAELTACNPVQNGTALDWTFTGKLKPGSSGEVFYEVVVE